MDRNRKKRVFSGHKNGEAGLSAVSAVLAVCFLTVITVILLLIVFLPDKQMSEKENRVLEQRPQLSLSSIISGSFMSNFESYLTDQFPARDKILSLKTLLDRSVGKKEENGVYIGKNGFLFEEQTAFDESHIKELTDSINAFAKENSKLKKAFILSPNSSYVLKQYLPTGLELPDQKQQLEKVGSMLSESGISWIDCNAEYEKAEDKDALFYRTDHHWTTYAAYLAFCSLAEEWKIDTSKVKYDFYSVSDSFKGTLSSSSGVSNSCDEIKICVPASSEGEYVVSYEASGRKSASLFEKDRLSGSNQYEVFLGGNYDKVVISTTANTENTLLVLKDSYANCMLPMLTPYFSRIVVVDPRYFNDRLSEVMKEYSFTHLLFVYNLNTFLGDTSLADTLAS